MGDKLDADHILDGIVGMLNFIIDWRGIATSGFKNDLMVKTEFHEIFWPGKFTTLTNTEDGALVSMGAGELEKGCVEVEWWTL